MRFKNYYELMDFDIFCVLFLFVIFLFHVQIVSFSVKGNPSGWLRCPFDTAPSHL